MKEFSATSGETLPEIDPASSGPDAVALPVQYLESEYADLPLDCIVASPTQPRTHFDQAKLDELAASIKADEVHTPIVVRPLPASRLQESFLDRKKGTKLPTHEIVFGERRWRASKIAGKATIPARVKRYTDAQVIEIQLIENLQREDLTELEEAEGYQRLMESSAITADAVAAKIGKSRSYVFARLKLLDLCTEARTSLRNGSIDASRALLVARIPDHKLQIKALKEIVGSHYYGSEPMTYRRAAEYVQSTYMLKLGSAKFKITSADLVPEAGSCKTCTKRTGHNPDLFSDVKGADVCTDPPCFHKKEEAHAATLVKEAKDRGQTVIAGKEAQELLTNGYQPKFKGYKRLDVAEDSPTDQPLRKIIGKQMQTEGVLPIMIEHPQKKGELVAALPNEVVSRLLKTVDGQAQAAKTVAKEVREFADEKKAKADAKAKGQYEQDWRQQLLARVWLMLRKAGTPPAFTVDVHRYLAVRAASNLSTDDSAALCKLLDLGKIAPTRALIDHVKSCPNPDELHLLMMMQHDSRAEDHSYGDHIANEALHLVARIVLKDSQEVIREVKAQSLEHFFPKTKPTKPPLPLPSAAQAKGGGSGAKVKSPAAPAGVVPERKRKLSAPEAQAAIAAAMQSQDTNPGAADASQGVVEQAATARPGAPTSAVGDDGIYQRAVTLIAQQNKASVRLLKTKLGIGTTRAIELMRQLETTGKISACGVRGTRKVLVAT